jgi:2-dehydropantoate 2-reductase
LSTASDFRFAIMVTTGMEQIAIIGAGPVGCAFAVHLVKAGHDVTIIGRGQRLANLQKNGGILLQKSGKAISKIPVKAIGTLNTTQSWNLIILAITEHQFDAQLFAVLKECPNQTEILFMFNTFASLEKYFDIFGKERCLMGFPAITAYFHNDILSEQFHTFGQISIVSSSKWRSILSSAEIKCAHEPDMQSWLRTHAAIVIGFQSAIVTAAKRKSGLRWGQAKLSAGAAREGLILIKKLGNNITPKYTFYIGVSASGFMLTGLLWIMTKVPSVRNSSQVPYWRGEMLALVESIIREAPSEDDVLLINQLKQKYV